VFDLFDVIARIVGYFTIVLGSLYLIKAHIDGRAGRLLSEIINECQMSWREVGSRSYEDWRYAVDFEGAKDDAMLAWFDRGPETFSIWWKSLPLQSKKLAQNHLMEHRTLEYLSRACQI
jgi:hypothetical protein